MVNMLGMQVKVYLAKHKACLREQQKVTENARKQG